MLFLIFLITPIHFFVLLVKKNLKHFRFCDFSSFFYCFFLFSDFSFDFFFCNDISIFFDLFFFSKIFFFNFFVFFLYSVFIVLLFFHFFFSKTVFFFFPIFFTFCSILFVLFFCLVIFLFFFNVKFLMNFFKDSLVGVFFFSNDFLYIENEDLWISANLFYFDNKIIDSEQLNLSLKASDVEVFYSLLNLFFKFPQNSVDSVYVSFSKNFYQTILGNNPFLYNTETNTIEPYVKAVYQKETRGYLNFGFLNFPSVFAPFEFKKADMAFYRVLLKYIFIRKGKSFLYLKKRRSRLNRLKRLLRKKRFKAFTKVDNFRLFYGLQQNSLDGLYTYYNKQYLKENYKFEDNRFFSSNLIFLASRFSTKNRHSRLESRFLKSFWISLPFYFSHFSKFLINAFPNLQAIYFYFSRLSFLFVKFVKEKIFQINSNVTVNSLDAQIKQRFVRNVSNFVSSENSSSDNDPSDLGIQDSSFIKFFNQKESKDKIKSTERLIYNNPRDGVLEVFDILNVNRAGLLDDLRKLNKKKTGGALEEESLTDSLEEENAEDSGFKKKETFPKSKDTKQESLNDKITDFYMKRLFQKKQIQDLDNLDSSVIEEGSKPEQFFTKRIRYRRFLRRRGTRLRAFWITRNRFFFSNQYNNLFEFKPRIEILDLYRLLEYFYFILINDRDLYETAEYAFVVSTLRERFGRAIVNDLLSTADHKQAKKVSVIMHVSEKPYDLKINDEPLEIISKEDFLNNKSQESLQIDPALKIFLSRNLQIYMYHLFIYYRSLHTKKKV